MKERPILFSAPMVRANREGRKTQTRRLIKHRISGPNPPFPPGTFDWYEGDKWVGAHQGNGVHPERRTHNGRYAESDNALKLCPYGVPGDRLYVRETWATRLDRDHVKPRDLVAGRDSIMFWADPQTCNTGCGGAAGKRRPSIFLPRWASRDVYEITEVRVQRLQDISEEDARAEGPLFAMDEEQTVLHPELTDERNIGCCACRGDARGIAELCHPDLRGKGRPFACWYALLWDSINKDRAPWSSNPWIWAVSYANPVTP